MSCIDTFVLEAMLVFGPLDREERVALLRDAIGALGQPHGSAFSGEDPQSARFIAGGNLDHGMTVMLVHPHLQQHSDPDGGWLRLSVSGDSAAGPTYLFMFVDAGRGDERPEFLWALGMSLLPNMATAIRPELGFASGKLIDDERFRALPPASSLVSAAPLQITPWTYMSSGRLAQSRGGEALQRLPFARIETLAHGVAFHAVASLDQAMQEPLARGLERLGIGYLPPQVRPSAADEEE